MTSGFTPEDMVRYSSVPDFPRAYVVGCLETRVSIYSQQVRALNLLWGLAKTGRLRVNDRVAIIGGGFAGVTFAAGAVRLGILPTIYEVASDLFHLQAGCQKRRVHPHIYEWPQEGWSRVAADLPVLNWSAGVTSDVVATLKSEFATLPIDKRLAAGNVDLCPAPGAIDVVEDAVDRPVSRFSAAIIAVGYGYTKTGDRYWSDDALEQYSPGDTVRRYRVSGLGDGAIVDALRIRLGRPTPGDSMQDWLETSFLPAVPLSIQIQLRELEQEMLALGDGDESAAQMDADYEVILQSGPQNLTTLVRDRLRSDTRLELEGRRAAPFSLKASCVHRFMTALLRHTDPTFRYVRAPSAVESDGPIPITRHATDSGRLVDSYPSIHTALRKTLLRQFDAPRLPAWSQHFFEQRIAPERRETRTLYFAHRPTLIARAAALGRLDWRAGLRGPLGFGIYAATSKERARAFAGALLNTRELAVLQIDIVGARTHLLPMPSEPSLDPEQAVISARAAEPFELGTRDDDIFCLYDGSMAAPRGQVE